MTQFELAPVLAVPSIIVGGLEHVLRAQRPCWPDSLLEEELSGASRQKIWLKQF